MIDLSFLIPLVVIVVVMAKVSKEFSISQPSTYWPMPT